MAQHQMPPPHQLGAPPHQPPQGQQLVNPPAQQLQQPLWHSHPQQQVAAGDNSDQMHDNGEDGPSAEDQERPLYFPPSVLRRYGDQLRHLLPPPVNPSECQRPGCRELRIRAELHELQIQTRRAQHLHSRRARQRGTAVGHTHAAVVGHAHVAAVGHAAAVGLAHAAVAGHTHTAVVGHTHAAAVGHTHTAVVGHAHAAVVSHAHSQPAPPHSQPAPVHSQPAPVHSQPAPAHSQPDPAHSQPAPVHSQPAPVHSQPVPVQSQPAPMEDSHSTDEEGSEELQLGIQTELQEHVSHMQMQNNMAVQIHAPVPMSQAPVGFPAYFGMDVPTPAFTPASMQAPMQAASHLSQPNAAQVPAQVLSQTPAQSPFSAPPSVFPPGPLQVDPTAQDHALAALPPTPTNTPIQPHDAPLQMVVLIPELSAEDMWSEGMPDGDIEDTPDEDMSEEDMSEEDMLAEGMDIHVPELSPGDMPIPCCISGCTGDHLTWLNAPIVEDSGLDSFDSTDITFDKYDDVLRRLSQVDEKLKACGCPKEPIRPKYKRKPKASQGSQLSDLPAEMLVDGPLQTEPANKGKIPEAVVSIPDTLPAGPVSRPTDGQVPPHAGGSEEVTSATSTQTSAEEAGQTEEESPEDLQKKLMAFSVLMLLENNRQTVSAAFDVRQKLQEELESVEKELEHLKKQGLMPWAT
ncbi:hypothetical protein SCUCBS95973_004794 [Sporothrix curviconia]|uniref:Uncharacterized protein n=1 Tax=Sporothrix curviconia TaxID=1260050 RepID=A0ABP0BRL1_9PEZI